VLLDGLLLADAYVFVEVEQCKKSTWIRNSFGLSKQKFS